MNIWEYIEREKIPVIPLYFANGQGRALPEPRAARPARFRSSPSAAPCGEIIEELRHTKRPSASGRAQDKESEDAFEKLRRDGYM